MGGNGSLLAAHVVYILGALAVCVWVVVVHVVVFVRMGGGLAAVGALWPSWMWSTWGSWALCASLPLALWGLVGGG